MNNSSVGQRTARFASAFAAAAVAVGLLAIPGTAHADPACTRYEFKGGLFQIEQDNHVIKQFPAIKDKLSGKAMYAIPGKTTGTFGDAIGGINGRTINITATWTQGQGAGLASSYKGQVDADGRARGTTTNSHGATNKWWTNDTLSCASAPAPAPAPVPVPAPAPAPVPAPAPAPAPAVLTARVTSDVDLYEGPHGEGYIRILRKGEVVKVASPCVPNDHCKLLEPKGFAWGKFLENI